MQPDCESMLVPPIFEIRVGVIGYVSVGKTTVINALFGAAYGEVSMKRTTAVVNAFRVSTRAQAGAVEEEYESESSEGSGQGSFAWSMQIDKLQTAADALKESTADNATFRNVDHVKQKTFDIVLHEGLHEMRKDTKLVIVDIPGINEAGTSSKYKDYVNQNWHTFDIVVVVTDARQGVNTEEQHVLLELMKTNQQSSKNVPIIILCNKVDDPDEEEQRLLLDEARTTIQDLFGVSDRQDALKTLLEEADSMDKTGTEEPYKHCLFPAVIPISAMHAFVYRCGSRLSFDEFCTMDKDFIEKIGKESYGRQWRRWDAQKKLGKAFAAVSNEEQRCDGVEASNFDSFVKSLAYCIGDQERQTYLIQQQVKVSLERLSRTGGDHNTDLGAEILGAHKKLDSLGMETTGLKESFWIAYTDLKNEAFTKFAVSTSPSILSDPMKQLLSYYKTLKETGWEGEVDKTVKHVKELVLRYTAKLLDSIYTANSIDLTLNENDRRRLILGSLLLVSNEWEFCTHFGPLKIELESRYIAACAQAGSFHALKYSDGQLVPVDKVAARAYEEDTTVEVPDSPKDPNHYGHLIWQCCRLLKAVKVREGDDL
jgi:GTPase SAR1 family protein